MPAASHQSALRSSAARPLVGLPVADISRTEAGALLGRWLADFGARVRRAAPDLAGPGPSALAAVLHAGKERVEVPWTTLLADADVVVEDLAPGTLERSDVGYARLSERNPGLILCSLTGYGQDGPLCRRAWSELTVQAAAGMAATTGFDGDPPTVVGAPIGAYMGALYGLIGVLAAIRYRGRTGLGQHIDISLQECLATIEDMMLIPVFLGGSEPPRFGNAHGYIAPYNLYPTLDGGVVLTTSSGAQWESALRAIGRPDLVGDARWATPAQRACSPEVDALIGAWTGVRTTEVVLAAFAEHHLPAAPVLEPAEILRNPQLAHRGMLAPSPSGVALGSPFGRWTSAEPIQDMLPAGVREPRPGAAARALEGVVVIDAGHVHAVPVGTRVLAELGATVIRVERPEGDLVRAVAPFVDGESYVFGLYNTDKLAVTLDLRREDERARFLQLVRSADLLFENFSVGTARRLGIGERDVRPHNPRLVYVSLSGFGQDGPQANLPAFDLVIQAMGGVMAVTGWPHRPATKSGPPILDRLSGLTAAAAGLAALLERERSGCGQYVDVAMLDVGVALSAPRWLPLRAAGAASYRMGNHHPDHAPHNVYRARDGWLAIAVLDDDQWSHFAAATGLPCLAAPELARAEGRRAAEDELDRDVGAWVAAQAVDDVLERLDPLGVPVAPVRRLVDLQADAQLAARGSFVPLERPGRTPLTGLASPLRMSRTPGVARRFGPRLGEHDAELLGDREEARVG